MARIKDENGGIHISEMDILKIQQGYFAIYITEKYQLKITKKIEHFIRSCNNPNISKEQKNICEGPFTEADILAPLKQTNKGSAPRSDGITNELYRVFGNQTAGVMIWTFSEIFHRGQMCPVQGRPVTTLKHEGKELLKAILCNRRPIS